MQRYKDWLSEKAAPLFLQLYGLSIIIVSRCLFRSTVIECKCWFSIMCLHIVFKVTIHWNCYSTILAYQCIFFSNCLIMHYRSSFAYGTNQRWWGISWIQVIILKVSSPRCALNGPFKKVSLLFQVTIVGGSSKTLFIPVDPTWMTR